MSYLEKLSTDQDISEKSLKSLLKAATEGNGLCWQRAIYKGGVSEATFSMHGITLKNIIYRHFFVTFRRIKQGYHLHTSSFITPHHLPSSESYHWVYGLSLGTSENHPYLRESQDPGPWFTDHKVERSNITNIFYFFYYWFQESHGDFTSWEWDTLLPSSLVVLLMP